MSKLIFLGSSNAIPDLTHENSHMAVVGEVGILLIDCVGNPMVRLPQAGVDLRAITDVILTHFHPDHVSGIALLLMDLWLLGRNSPLNLYGLEYTLSRVEKMMDLYGWDAWPGFFPVRLSPIPEEEMAVVLENDEWRIFASPVNHLIPNVGLRLEFVQSGKTLIYSSDTEPCPQVVRLARDADVLIHEATGSAQGHSSASQAGEIASQARAKRLYLIHYPTGEFMNENLITEAQRAFGGPVSLAEDFLVLEF
jgi:ribonuclease Z